MGTDRGYCGDPNTSKEGMCGESSSHFDEKMYSVDFIRSLTFATFHGRTNVRHESHCDRNIFQCMAFHQRLDRTLIPHKTGSSIIVSVVVFLSTTWLWENISLSFHEVFLWSLNIGKANIHEIVN